GCGGLGQLESRTSLLGAELAGLSLLGEVWERLELAGHVDAFGCSSAGHAQPAGGPVGGITGARRGVGLALVDQAQHQALLVLQRPDGPLQLLRCGPQPAARQPTPLEGVVEPEPARACSTNCWGQRGAVAPRQRGAVAPRQRGAVAPFWD